MEERKRIALEALALEVEEFKTQERLKLLQRAKRDVEAEVDVEEDSAETESSEKVEIFDLFRKSIRLLETTVCEEKSQRFNLENGIQI